VAATKNIQFSCIGVVIKKETDPLFLKMGVISVLVRQLFTKSLVVNTVGRFK
jgi:hypothetical protein